MTKGVAIGINLIRSIYEIMEKLTMEILINIASSDSYVIMRKGNKLYKRYVGIKYRQELFMILKNGYEYEYRLK